MHIGKIAVNTDSQYIADRVWSQVQVNQAYLKGRRCGSVQVDGEKYKWLRISYNEKKIQNVEA